MIELCCRALRDERPAACHFLQSLARVWPAFYSLSQLPLIFGSASRGLFIYPEFPRSVYQADKTEESSKWQMRSGSRNIIQLDSK